MRSGWADGPAYITQCPIQSGQSYVYNFTITGQRGTLFWHAHISWLRVTLYGPIIILPKHGDFYPFPHPYKEVPIVFGKTIFIFLGLFIYKYLIEYKIIRETLTISLRFWLSLSFDGIYTNSILAYEALSHIHSITYI